MIQGLRPARGEENLAQGRQLLIVRLALALLLTVLVLGRDGLLAIRRHTAADLAKNVSVGAVVGLRPPVKRVLMALGAFEANAHERVRSLLAPLFQRRVAAAKPKQV